MNLSSNEERTSPRFPKFPQTVTQLLIVIFGMMVAVIIYISGWIAGGWLFLLGILSLGPFVVVTLSFGFFSGLWNKWYVQAYVVIFFFWEAFIFGGSIVAGAHRHGCYAPAETIFPFPVYFLPPLIPLWFLAYRDIKREAMINEGNRKV